MGDTPSKRPHPPRGRIAFLVLAGVLGLAISAGSGFGILTINHVEANLTKICVGRECSGPNSLISVTPQCFEHACNYLILGSDSRKGAPRQIGTTQGSPGQRSDTIMVVTVDTRINRTVVLSIPRDLRVDIPGYGMNKINTAINHPGGRDLMVRTVENLTGLSINHYIEVNFLGFEGVVDAVGGVPICVNRPLLDTLAGLNLPHAGCYNLKGAQALAFVRARHIVGDNIPDFSRISRQQQFMRALISKALSAGSLFKLPDLINAVQDNLTIDKNLNLYELQDLTRTLAKVGQVGVAFRIVPAVPLVIDGIDYLQLEQPQASQLFDRIRHAKRLGTVGITGILTSISPANVTVQVLDANSGGQAQKVVDFLQKAGFVVLPVQQAPSDLTTSEILWNTESAAYKEVVASYLTLLPVRRDRNHISGSTVAVVVGSDFPGFEGLAGAS